MKRTVNNMGNSVSATELAKLGKFEMLVIPNREHGAWFRFRKPTDSIDSVATEQGEAAGILILAVLIAFWSLYR
jgi:hypothetical protein